MDLLLTATSAELDREEDQSGKLLAGGRVQTARIKLFDEYKVDDAGLAGSR